MMYKSAIIGYGGMGNWHHASIKEKISRMDVKGVWYIRPEVKETAAKNGVSFYSSLDELLNDKELDIVTIATPNNFHKELSIACMKAGKNVVCEKPVTLNSGELEEIIKVSEQTGKIFSVHQNRRWDKDFVIVKKILNDNIIGKPYYIESRVQGSRRSLHGWRGHKVNGGGMVYDWGVHLIDQLLFLIDSPVVSVDASLYNIFSTEVDDNFKATLKFDNGINALVEIATNCFINQPRWHVSCNEGTAVVNDWDCSGKIVKLSDNKIMEWADDIVYTSAGPTRTMAPRPSETVTTLSLPEVETDWADYYNNIIDTIENNAELIVKPSQSLRVMNVIDSIFEASASGQSVKCRI